MKTKLLSKTKKPTVPSSFFATQKKKIVIIDDHPIIRRGLADLINREADLVVSADAADAHEGLKTLAQVKPDLAIVDISLADMNGLELIKTIKERYPKLPTIVLSMHNEEFYAERALRAGARGYLMKVEAPENVVSAIRRVLNSEIYVSEKMSSKLLSKMAKGVDVNASPVDSLSDRELEVFQLIGNAMGTRQIADKLCLSIKTIESYREHIKTKLNLENSNALFQHALNWVQNSQGQ